MDTIAIRKENIELTEKRAPFTPQQVGGFINKLAIKVIVEPWSNRWFKNNDYIKNGAILSDDITKANIIFGVKEVPLENLLPNKTFAFFSHTIKGQIYNMPLLQAILDKNVTLIDYEKVTDDYGKRLIFFGPYAGLAGAVDALWLLGERLTSEGIKNPFHFVKQAQTYHSLTDAKKIFKKVAEAISKDGLPRTGKPWVIAVTGNGTVSKGVQEMIDILPVTEISPAYFLELQHFQNFDLNRLYKVVIDCDNFVKPIDPKAVFDWKDYFDHPEKYQCYFTRYLPDITVLINGIFWDTMYPRLVTKSDLEQLFTKDHQPNLQVIADIACDIEGSIECNLKTTTSDNPAYVYNPFDQSIKDGTKGVGPIILAVDKLPSELPAESSAFFGQLLTPFVPALAETDFNKNLKDLIMPVEFKRAIIAHKGKLTPDFEYLYNFL